MEVVERNTVPPFYIELVNRSANNWLVIDIVHLPKKESFDLEITSYYRYFLFKNRVFLLDENGVNLTSITPVGAGSPKFMESFVFIGTHENPYVVELKNLTELGFEENIYYLNIGLRTYELEFDKKYTLFVMTNGEKSNEVVLCFKSPNVIQRRYRNFQFYWRIKSFSLKCKYREFMSRFFGK